MAPLSGVGCVRCMTRETMTGTDEQLVSSDEFPPSESDRLPIRWSVGDKAPRILDTLGRRLRFSAWSKGRGTTPLRRRVLL